MEWRKTMLEAQSVVRIFMGVGMPARTRPFYMMDGHVLGKLLYAMHGVGSVSFPLTRRSIP